MKVSQETKQTPDVEKEKQKKFSSLAKTLSVYNLYKKIFDRVNGSIGKLTLCTLSVMAISQLPLYFFTFLDILKLDSLLKYRLHYKADLSGHLGVRNYPPLDVIFKTWKLATFNYILTQFIPTGLGLYIGGKAGILPYDIDCEEDKLSWKRLAKEFAVMCVLVDMVLFSLHNFCHLPQFYQAIHKKHHDFKYNIAFALYWLEPIEALLLLPAQGLLPILCRIVLGRKVHVTSVWAVVLFIQFSAALGHGGYRVPTSKWFPFLQPAWFHDFHHVDPTVNFGFASFADRLFGTYVTPGLEYDLKTALKAKPLSLQAFGC